MKRIFFSFFLAWAMTSTYSCVKQNEEDLSGAKYCAIDTPSYQQHIAPLISDRCENCHKPSNAQAGVIVNNHADLADLGINGVLLGVIRHENGYLPMPASSPKMPDCEIQVIQKWIEQGALNN